MAEVAVPDFVDGVTAEVFGALPSGDIVDRLTAAQTAYGHVNAVHDLIAHPQLRTRRMPVGGHVVEVPAVPWVTEWDGDTFAAAPALDAHGAAIRAEFAPQPETATR